MKKTQPIIKRNLEDFEKEVNLYNIVKSGSGKAVQFLREIAEEAFDRSCDTPAKRPSILIIGKEGKTSLTRAFLNSVIIEDIRECDARYIDNGFTSKEFFENSLQDTAHILLNIEGLRPMSEATIWRYLRFGWCSYPNFQSRSRDYVHLNGILILAASTLSKVGKPIQKAVKYTVHMEPYNQEQLFAICHQYLKIFCGIKYRGEKVLHSIVEYGNGEVSRIYELMKLIMLVLKTEQVDDVISEKIVEKASRLMG